MKTICVMPAYNEEKHIASAISSVKPYVDEVIVVDDCSSDRTAEIVKKTQALLISHPINRGQGAALQTGTSLALKRGAQIIIHFDSDNQFKAEEIPEMVAPIKSQEVQAVLGSRFLDKKSDIPSFKKHIIMPLAKSINRIFFNIKLSDPQNGFRALSREAAEKLNIKNDGMAHCSEILHQLHKHKIKIKEVPITVTYHEFGQKFSGGVRIIKDLIIKKIIK